MEINKPVIQGFGIDVEEVLLSTFDAMDFSTNDSKKMTDHVLDEIQILSYHFNEKDELYYSYSENGAYLIVQKCDYVSERPSLIWQISKNSGIIRLKRIIKAAMLSTNIYLDNYAELENAIKDSAREITIVE